MTSQSSLRTPGLLSFIAVSALLVGGCRSKAPADVPLDNPPVAPAPAEVPVNNEVDAVVVKEGADGALTEVNRVTVDTETLAPAPAPEPAATPAVIVEEPAAPVVEAVEVVEAAEPVEVRRVRLDAAKVGAASAARFIKVGIPAHFGDEHGKLIVQVNRAVNRSTMTVDRSALLRGMQSAIRSRNVALSSAYAGRLRSDQPKAIHTAFEQESRFLGIIPDNRVARAPEVILNSIVEEDPDSGARLVLRAVDTRTGEVFWTESSPLLAYELVPPGE